MRYYRDIDYFIYFEEFPHMGIPGVITSNSDGTANIYINTLYTPARQQETLKHELRHLILQHQYCDWKTLSEKEKEAGEDDPSCIFGEDFSYAEYRAPQLPPKTTEAEEEGTPGGLNPGADSRLPNVFKENPQGTIPYFASLETLKQYMYAMREQTARDRKSAGIR